MNLVTAFNAMLKLAGNAGIEGHWDLVAVDTGTEFIQSNLDLIDALYDKAQDPDVSSDMPCFDRRMLSHPEFTTSEIGAMMRVCIEKALEVIEEDLYDTVVIEPEDSDGSIQVSSMEAVAVVCQFWSKHGSEFTKAVKDAEVSAECDMAM
jgi:hypothetical protein